MLSALARRFGCISKRFGWASGIMLALVGLIGIMWYRPVILLYHAAITDRTHALSGTVFRKGTNVFLVELNTGSVLTIDLAQQTILLATQKRGLGLLRFGRYWVVSQRDLRGIDLTKAEGFRRAKPTVNGGLVQVSDPMTPDGAFSFPLKGDTE